MIFTRLALTLAAATAVLAAPAADANAANGAPDFELNTKLTKRQNYNQNYQTSGDVIYSPTNNGYDVKYAGANDFVVGKGWTTGSWKCVYRT
jgi:endo-1,4-beta-xylanase